MFSTPDWLLDKNIFDKIESAGNVERIRSTQVRTLNDLLDHGKMARLIENEALNTKDAYTLINMMTELRLGLWSELQSAKVIDVYRRNLQRAYVDRMGFLMKKDQPEIPKDMRPYVKRTTVNASQSDIRAIVRAELKAVLKNTRIAVNKTKDKMTRYHLLDIIERISLLLELKK